MTALVVLVAVVVGVACSEVFSRSAGRSAWPARRLAVMRGELSGFHEATDDDARQAHLIRGGMATFTLSLGVLAVIAGVAAVFAAPLLLLGWDETQSAVYLAVSGVSAIAWWMLRGARHAG